MKKSCSCTRVEYLAVFRFAFISIWSPGQTKLRQGHAGAGSSYDKLLILCVGLNNKAPTCSQNTNNIIFAHKEKCNNQPINNGFRRDPRKAINHQHSSTTHTCTFSDLYRFISFSSICRKCWFLQTRLFRRSLNTLYHTNSHESRCFSAQLPDQVPT